MVRSMFEPAVRSVWDLLQLFKEESPTNISGDGEGVGGHWACWEMSEPLNTNVQIFTTVNFDIRYRLIGPVNAEENG